MMGITAITTLPPNYGVGNRPGLYEVYDIAEKKVILYHGTSKMVNEAIGISNKYVSEKAISGRAYEGRYLIKRCE